jgi:hypothetical protein
MEYLQQHLKHLLNELAYAYANNLLDRVIVIKRQIKELKEMLNHYEKVEFKFRNNL